MRTEDVAMSEDYPELEKYDYDLVVIGGGSGGLAASKVSHFCNVVCIIDDIVCMLMCLTRDWCTVYMHRSMNNLFVW